jgi:hypothetical protein
MVLSDRFDLDQDLEQFCIRFEGYDLLSGISQALELVTRGEYPDLRKRFKAHMNDRYSLSIANYTNHVVTLN